MATTHSLDTKKFYERNTLSFLRIASYWVKQRVWDRAIAALRAAIRNATRAGRHDVAGESFKAIRQCQEWQRLDAPEELRDAAAAAGRQ